MRSRGVSCWASRDAICQLAGWLFIRSGVISPNVYSRNTSPPSMVDVTKPERRRDIQRALRAAGCVIRSDAGDHTKWICKCGAHTANIPRHGSISPGVVANTIKRLTCLPEGWLQ